MADKGKLRAFAGLCEFHKVILRGCKSDFTF